MSSVTSQIHAFVLLLCSAALVAGPSAAATPPPPEPRDRAEVEAVLAKAPKAPQDQKPMHIVLLAGKKDHGPEGNDVHDYPLWQKCWASLLGGKGEAGSHPVNLYGPPAKISGAAGLPNVTVSTAWDWPSQEQLDSADVVVMFNAPKWNEKTIGDLKAFLARGGGFVVVHMSIWRNSAELADVLGMAKGPNTKFRHGHARIDITATDHPICRGLPKVLEFEDETYYNFQGDTSQVDVLATCNEKLPGANEPTAEPMYWTRQVGKGRVFVCILGHFTWTFDDPYFRILLLRGTAWAAGDSPYRLDPLVLRGARVTSP